MKITFHGATRTVTGSKHLLELKNGKKILLDCGMFQGGKELMEFNYQFGFEPKDLDVLVVSHAHIDHTGLIPRLIAQGFRGPIFCTPATEDLMKILLRDSAKIQEADIEYINKKRKNTHQPPIEPLFTSQDVEQSLTMLQTFDYNQPFKVIEDVECTYTDAGHILGSASVNLKIKENGTTTKILFSGDVGRYSNPILRSPQAVEQADYVICESTYGDTLHDDVAMSDKVLDQIIYHTCVEKKGKLLIPAFSVGRTQEVVYALNRLEFFKKLPNIKVYVDSPMSNEATKVTEEHVECYNKDLIKFMERDIKPFDFKNLTYIQDVEQSKSLNSLKEPCIIISASGMAEFGRIKHHIANNIENPNTTILIVGYCEPSSLGAKLQQETDEVRIFGQFYKKKAEIQKIKSFSAHADYEDLFHYLSSQDPKKVKKLFLVHGEYEVQIHFKQKLVKKGFDFVEIPDLHQEFYL